jgi:lysophospholipase L1-like esterase
VARNTVFGIRSTTHRRRIAGRYAANLDALAEMLRLSQQRGVRVLVYIAPIRGDVPTPYDPAEYAAFIQDVRQLAERSGVQFADLQTLVPAPLWGVKAAGIAGVGDTEVDFMHFRAAGHALLAERVAALLGLPPAATGASQ